MKGKILGHGIISGDDGLRYHFQTSDIVNLENKDPNKLSGSEVDFVANDGNASEIFLTKSTGLNIDTQNISQNLLAIRSKITSVDLAGAKTNIFIAVSAFFFAYFLGNNASIPIAIVGAIFMLWSSFIVKQVSDSKDIFKNTILIVVFAVLMLYSMKFGIQEAATIALFGGKTTKIYIYFTAGIVFFALYFEFIRRYCSELEKLTSQRLFKISSYIAAIWAAIVIIALVVVLFKNPQSLQRLFFANGLNPRSFVDYLNFFSFMCDASLIGFVISFIAAWVQTKKIEKV